MEVLKYIRNRLQKGKVHMSLIDPDKQPPSAAGMIARGALEAGTDAIMVGGSTGVTQGSLDATLKSIKKEVDIPVILFPTGAHTLSEYADGIYFMSLLNSRSLEKIIGEQKKASRIVKGMELETISMGYVIVEPGMRAGEIGRADPIPRDDVDTAIEYGLVAEFLGMNLYYLEAGSGAPSPVPEKMISAVKQEIGIPLVVGGGIRLPSDAMMVSNAGADIIVTGTVIEESGTEHLREIVQAIRKAQE